VIEVQSSQFYKRPKLWELIARLCLRGEDILWLFSGTYLVGQRAAMARTGRDRMVRVISADSLEDNALVRRMLVGSAER
jgi:hypothetical protein